MLRFPMFWEDDYEMKRHDPIMSINDIRLTDNFGLKVMNFHPIHVALNSRTNGAYDLVKHEIVKKNRTLLTYVKERQIERYKNTDVGVGSFFKELVEFLAGTQHTHTIEELSEQFRRGRR